MFFLLVYLKNGEFLPDRTVSTPGKQQAYSLRSSPFKARIKPHLLFAGIITSSPFSPR